MSRRLKLGTAGVVPSLGRTITVFNKIELEIDEASKLEIRRRFEELKSGKIKAIPGDIVSQRIRKLVGRAR